MTHSDADYMKNLFEKNIWEVAATYQIIAAKHTAATTEMMTTMNDVDSTERTTACWGNDSCITWRAGARALPISNPSAQFQMGIIFTPLLFFTVIRVKHEINGHGMICWLFVFWRVLPCSLCYVIKNMQIKCASRP